MRTKAASGFYDEHDGAHHRVRWLLMVLNQLMRCVSHVTVNGLCMSAAWSDSFVSHAERALNLRTIDVVQRCAAVGARGA